MKEPDIDAPHSEWRRWYAHQMADAWEPEPPAKRTKIGAIICIALVMMICFLIGTAPVIAIYLIEKGSP